MTDRDFARPAFPRKAVVTAGMPYGNKALHFGHIGGVFVHADIYARFLRDRIGAENVIFVSGTDCYGATIEAGYEQEAAAGFDGSLLDYVRRNHEIQKETLDRYQISLNLFGASALDEAGEIHAALSADIFNRLLERGALGLEQTLQFFDEEKAVFLNGRQVTGRCPIQGCKSETAYADECALGHQYSPAELIAPVSVLSGKPPAQVAVRNWFFDLPSYRAVLEEKLEAWEQDPVFRKSLTMVIREFMKNPAIYVKKELIDEIKSLPDMPPFTLLPEEQKPSRALEFGDLEARSEAVAVLAQNGIRCRTGKTLVPFRLSGNVRWGIPVPGAQGVSGLTFWVWPESLWAPISFTKAVLGDGIDGNQWEDWWKSDDARVYQFIGEDNIYFYAIAEMGLFLALDEGCRLPLIVPNHHLLYGKTKASSSGARKPPMAAELLEHYTPEQLRLHFMNASLSERNVSFEPRAFLDAGAGFDAVLNEGNLVTNVFNRLARSCFYTAQKYNDGLYPAVAVGAAVKEKSDETILAYERLMAEISFDKIFELLNLYLRDANKSWSARSRSAAGDEMNQLLADTFHVVRVAAALFHPIVPAGCEMIRSYLGVDERIWDWSYIFEPLDFFIGPEHRLRFLEPRVDFFSKHPAQL
ncbi:MAG: class I tRNA ligase family protein [Oscillospiraceae bacterium]|nr:class I tRNA ligase family protein [Oscillospiraceae bacterium]